MHRYHPLTPKQHYVLINRGTEPPFSGDYLEANYRGVFLCAQCDLPLFLAEDQFFCSCGWPSFDQSIDESIIYKTDPDGIRCEVSCARCEGHLGHVFEGENLTEKNTRYCINSLAMRLNPLTIDNYHKAYFGAGCFWGVQYYMAQEKGVIKTSVGFMGGTVTNPTYEEVCEHKTHHIETIEVIFDPHVLSYEALTKLFFAIHNPTQENGQGPDIGEQYRSTIFYLSKNQELTSEKLIQTLEKQGLDIATQLKPASLFYPADSSHQNYYQKKGSIPYCNTKKPLI